jgi:hypothetical protein
MPLPALHLNRSTAAAVLAVASAALQPAFAGTYDGAILNPPTGCTFIGWSFPDTVPRARPVLLTLPSSPMTAYVNPYAPTPLGYREVVFSYNFTGLDQRLPPFFAGIFYVTSTRVIINKGPGWEMPVASDKVFTQNPSSVAWASTTTDGPAFYDKWAVRIYVQGYQQAYAKAPWKPAQVSFSCGMPIGAAPPPVFQ